MKKMALTIIVLFFGVLVSGIAIGTLLTQEQVDSLTRTQIINNFEFELESVQVDKEVVYFLITYNDVRLQEAGNYVVFRNGATVLISKEWLNKCINQTSLNYCKTNYLKPLLINEAKREGKEAIKRIEGYQNPQTDLFDQDSFTDLVPTEELNDVNNFIEGNQ